MIFRYKNYAAISVFVGTNKNLGIGGVRYAVKTIIKNKNFVNVRNKNRYTKVLFIYEKMSFSESKRSS